MICIWPGSTGSFEALSRKESLFSHGPPGLDQELCHPSITSKWLHGTYSSQEATAYPQGDGRLQDVKQCFCQACPLVHFSITFTNVLLRSPVVTIHFSCQNNCSFLGTCYYFPVRLYLVHVLSHSQDCRINQNTFCKV